ncbi:MAG: hypothetical protein FJ304_08035 [Planctomycetes bacterium]|nr:hypothetical protein [Planctomycetota bacterium]
MEWTPEAFQRMGQIVRNNPARRGERAAALNELTARLRAHGATAGESRGGSLRVSIAGPLTAFFVVDPGATAAEIVRVRVRFRA